MLFRSAANRAGCLIWPIPERSAPASPVRRQAPAPGPVLKFETARGPGPLPTPRPGALQRLWQWVASWLAFLRAGAAPAPAPATPRAAPPDLVSHPVVLDDASDSDDDGTDEIAQRPVLPPGPAIAPEPPTPAPFGLQLGFDLERVIDAPMHAIARLICDSEQGERWVEHCVESRLLAMTSTGPIAYHRYQLPWLGARDSVTRTTVHQAHETTLTLTVQPWETPDMPLLPGVDRMPWVSGSFTLTAITPETTHVLHASQIVLGGRISRLLWPVIRNRAHTKPNRTLERLAASVVAREGPESAHQ